jgi:hypothetical protein
MNEVTLKSGKTVKVDGSDLSRKDWLKFISQESSKEFEDSIIGKCTGLTPEELDDMPARDFNRLIKALVKDVQAPDPS